MATGLTISISLGGLIVIGIIVFVVLRHRRKVREAELREENKIEHLTAEQLLHDLTDDRIKDLLDREIMIGSTVYTVIALDKHSLVDDDMVPDEDEYWWILTCRDNVEQKTVHLSCEQDDDGVWEFLLFVELDKQVRMKIPELKGVAFDGDDNLPPKEFEYDFLTWTVLKDDDGEDEYDYTVHVSSYHKGRKDRVRDYLTQVTEYGSDVGNKLMYLELWNTSGRLARKGGGVSLSTGRELMADEINLFPKSKKK